MPVLRHRGPHHSERGGRRGRRNLRLLDTDPGSDGHLLVVPRRHHTDLLDIPADDLTAATLAAQWIAKVAVTKFGADGVNLIDCCGAGAWQTVFHFHLHLIPRYADKTKDRLTLPFEPGTHGHRHHYRPRPPARRCPDDGPLPATKPAATSRLSCKAD